MQDITNVPSALQTGFEKNHTSAEPGQTILIPVSVAALDGQPGQLCSVLSVASQAPRRGVLISSKRRIKLSNRHFRTGIATTSNRDRGVLATTQVVPVYALSPEIGSANLNTAADVVGITEPNASSVSVSDVANDARQLGLSVTTLVRQQASELIGGPGTSDASIGPIGPPSHDQSPPLAHLDGLSRGLAGVSEPCGTLITQLQSRSINQSAS